MSIQQNIQSDLYRMADMARTPQQIQSLQQHITASIKDGAVESYVGVPLLQSLNQRLKQAQMMAQGQQGQQLPQGAEEQPAIADQIMQEAQQDEQPGGVDQLPSNLYGYEPEGQQEQDQEQGQEEGYRGGGIVAFADTGLVGERDRFSDYVRAAKPPKDEFSMQPFAGQEVFARKQDLPETTPQNIAETIESQNPNTYESVTTGGLEELKIAMEKERAKKAAIEAEQASAAERAKYSAAGNASQQGIAGIPTAQQQIQDNETGSRDASTALVGTPGAKGAVPSTGIAGARGAQGTPTGQGGQPVRPAAPGAPGTPQPTAGETAVQPAMSVMDRYTKMLEDQGIETKKERESAKWTALLMGGLGVAGGTSPNPLANLSAGALPAIQEYDRTMAGLRKEDAQRLEKLLSAGISKEKFRLEAHKLDISEKRADQMHDVALERNGILRAQHAAAGSADARMDRRLSAEAMTKADTAVHNATQDIARAESAAALRYKNDPTYVNNTTYLKSKNLKPEEKAKMEEYNKTFEADVALGVQQARQNLAYASRVRDSLRPEMANSNQQTGVPKDLPSGTKFEKTTPDGKKVYKLPNGEFVVQE